MGAEHRARLAAIRSVLGDEAVIMCDANPNPLREEVFPIAPREGLVTLSEAHGLGVEPDLARLGRWMVRH